MGLAPTIKIAYMHSLFILVICYHVVFNTEDNFTRACPYKKDEKARKEKKTDQVYKTTPGHNIHFSGNKQVE